jgi:hypothetical protein
MVGVWTHGAADCDIPGALDEYADAVVGWQADRIQGAICGDINDWDRSDGGARELREIERYGCCAPCEDLLVHCQPGLWICAKSLLWGLYPGD